LRAKVEKMATTYLGSFIRHDGYNGHTCAAHWVFDPASKLVLEVHPCGWFRADGDKHTLESAERFFEVESVAQAA
jgi:hypothetical protein